MRLFVAAVLPEALRDRLAQAQRALADLPFKVRWVKTEGIHLTFAFLGEVAAARLATIQEALAASSCSALAPFGLAARGVGVFPERGRPKVVWAGVDGDLEAAGRLKRVVDEALEPLGFAPEPRPFRPHLTLGRVTDGGGEEWRRVIERHRDEDFGAFQVTACHLFESLLGPGGARYNRIASFGPGGGSAAP
jgi:RNA 2',3'-cyclic 3'-phosphodiesterase